MLAFGAIAELAIAQARADDPNVANAAGSPQAETATASGLVTKANAATGSPQAETATMLLGLVRVTTPGGQASDFQQAQTQELWRQREKERYRARLKAQRLRYEAKLALERAEKELEAEKIEQERQVQLEQEAEMQRLDDEEVAFLLLVA